MEPWTIYIVMAGTCLVVLILVAIFRYQITRSCPLCSARVELGRPRCQICGYRFSTARY